MENVKINGPSTNTIHDDNSSIMIMNSLKDENCKKYERVYILFLWISAFSVIIIATIVSIGVGYTLLKQNYIINVGDSGLFMFASAFLLCGSAFSIFSGVLTCTITSTKGKFILTILVGYLFSIGLIVSNSIIINLLQDKIDNSFTVNHRNSILKKFQYAINNTIYSDDWIKIHNDFNCCGLEIYDDNFDQKDRNNNNSTDNKIKQTVEQGLIKCKRNDTNLNIHNCSSIKTFQNIILYQKEEEVDNENHLNDTPSTDSADINSTVDQSDSTTKDHISITINSNNKAFLHFILINKKLCPNLNENIRHRECGWLLLNSFEKKTHLIKFYNNLLLPMLLIACTLCILGYTVLKRLTIKLNKQSKSFTKFLSKKQSKSKIFLNDHENINPIAINNFPTATEMGNNPNQ